MVSKRDRTYAATTTRHNAHSCLRGDYNLYTPYAQSNINAYNITKKCYGIYKKKKENFRGINVQTHDLDTCYYT